MSKYGLKLDLKINVGHSPVILPYIFMNIWWINITLFDYVSVLLERVFNS